MKTHSEALESLSKEQLIELLAIYSKNWLAIDGLWFQTVEKKYDMDEAMFHDIEVWKRFSGIEARRIKQFLGLSEHPGVEGLVKAMGVRCYANLNEDELIVDGNTVIYRTLACRVQHARALKGLPFHPCKSVGLIEYDGFAKGIDSRFSCECLSCYPDATDDTCHCAWKFVLNEEGEDA